MPRTTTIYWRNHSSGWFNFNWNNVIFDGSVVHIAACEWAPESHLQGAPPGKKFQGQATIYVKNVVVHGGDTYTGGVQFYLQIDWPNPLNVVTDITVFDPAEQNLDPDAGN